MRLVQSKMLRPSSIFLADLSMALLLLWMRLVICVPCLTLSYRLLCSMQLVVACWEMADLLTLMCLMFSCILSLFHDDLGQVWYLSSVEDIGI